MTWADNSTDKSKISLFCILSGLPYLPLIFFFLYFRAGRTTTLCSRYQGPRSFGDSQQMQAMAHTHTELQADFTTYRLNPFALFYVRTSAVIKIYLQFATPPTSPPPPLPFLDNVKFKRTFFSKPFFTLNMLQNLRFF